MALILGGITLHTAANRLPASLAFDPLGPGGFPALLALSLIGSGLALMAQSIIPGVRMASHKGRQAAETTARPESGRLVVLRLVGAIGLTAAYVAVLQPAGFLISTPGYLAALLLLQRRVPAREFLLTVIVFPLGLFAVFELLGVTLPLGVLEPLWYRLRYGGMQ